MINSILIQDVTLEQLTKMLSAEFSNQLKIIAQSQSSNFDQLLTREETCKFLQIDSSTLWHWTNKGKVNAYGIANRRYYKKSEILECLTLLKK